MVRHGSESYFVVGEGLLGATAGERVLAAASAVPPFHLSRMGPKGDGEQLGQPNRKKIADAMTVDNLSPGAKIVVELPPSPEGTCRYERMDGTTVHGDASGEWTLDEHGEADDIVFFVSPRGRSKISSAEESSVN